MNAGNHKFRQKIQDRFSETEPGRSNGSISNKSAIDNQKIKEIENAMQDELFLDDLKNITDDFKDVDLEGWQE